MPTVNNGGRFVLGLGLRLEPRRGNEAQQRVSCCRASPTCGVCELAGGHSGGCQTRLASFCHLPRHRKPAVFDQTPLRTASLFVRRAEHGLQRLCV
jgi:hypothetical protein